MSTQRKHNWHLASSMWSSVLGATEERRDVYTEKTQLALGQLHVELSARSSELRRNDSVSAQRKLTDTWLAPCGAQCLELRRNVWMSVQRKHDIHNNP